MSQSTRYTRPHVDLERQIGLWLRVVVQRHAENFYKCVGSGLTQGQYAVLARLNVGGKCSQNLLGRFIGLDAASIVGVVRRLEGRGLVSIAKSEHDRRLLLIDLTAAGRSLFCRTAEFGFQANEMTLAPLNQDERQQLIGLLKRIARPDHHGGL
jgi:DNA-binding MarR family transcriptional regulator